MKRMLSILLSVLLLGLLTACTDGGNVPESDGGMITETSRATERTETTEHTKSSTLAEPPRETHETLGRTDETRGEAGETRGETNETSDGTGDGKTDETLDKSDNARTETPSDTPAESTQTNPSARTKGRERRFAPANA